MADHSGFALDDEALYRSNVPRFGTVRVVVKDGDYAIVLDDLNSDGREVELRAYRRDTDGWREIFDQTDVRVPEAGSTKGESWSASGDGGYGWAYGLDEPGTIITLGYRDEPLHVTTNARGWWLFIRETDDQVFDIPYRVN